MSGKASNIPMWIVTRMFEIAVYVALGWLAFEAAIKGLSMIGISATYENAANFYFIVAGFTVFPFWSHAIYSACCLFNEIELFQSLDEKLEPARIEPLLTQEIDDSIPTLPRDRGTRFFEDI